MTKSLTTTRDAWVPALTHDATAAAPHQQTAPMENFLSRSRAAEHIERGRSSWQAMRDALLHLQTKYGNFFTAKPAALSVDTRGALCIAAAASLPQNLPQNIREDFARDLLAALTALKPWRKGPFSFDGLFVDAEWNSALKYDRIASLCTSLCNLEELCRGKAVLDVGCNNFYYALRFMLYKPRLVLALDPVAHYAYFYDLFSMLMPQLPLYWEFAGAPLEACFEASFDTIFFLGILYHQRNPLECLRTLNRALKRGGALVLETICIDSADDLCLFPRKTYQGSAGFWFIPSPSAACNLLTRSGFDIDACGDAVLTTSEEQRKTQWMQSHSLADFLDPNDASKTIDGYPAPRRCIIIARKR